MIISKTPYRISFFGGGSDYPSHCNEVGGQVLSCTIDKYCYITLRSLPPFFEHKYRIVYSKIEHVMSPSEIQHPVIRATLLDQYYEKLGLEIHHDGDLPARSGLGSSSSFAVGFYNTISNKIGEMKTARELADYAIYLEQELLKEHVGYQDQIAVAHGGLNRIVFQPGGGYRVEKVKASLEKIRELNSHLLLFFTGVTRLSSEVAKKQIDSASKNRDSLIRMANMVDDGVKILENDTSCISDFGLLLDDAWNYKKSLTAAISNASIDEIYELAKSAGSIGGKILGAGGGGFMLFFAPPERHDSIKGALRKLVHVPFEFEHTGSRIIFNGEE